MLRSGYFWGTQSGAALDLLIVMGDRRVGFEVKYQDAPKITQSMRIAMDDLKLDRLYVVYPGDQSYQMDEKIYLVHLKDLESMTAL